MCNVIKILSLKDFLDSHVAYNLDSPTVSLENVFFPSLTICNMNTLRKSFITSLMTDAKIQKEIGTNELKRLVDDVFISGGDGDLSQEETNILELSLIHI